MGKIPKVQVLMSTYNGEKYIDEQIESIMAQKKVSVNLLIRDDGSTDNTWKKLIEIEKKYKNKIVLIKGTNIGYRKSFLSLFNRIDENCDYYAYSDQDDVWQEGKLKVAVDFLSNSINSWLYACSLTITDEDLNYISKKTQSSIKQTLGSFFVRTRLAGCTMVFKKELANILTKYASLPADKSEMPDHDCLLCMLCMIYNTSIILDNNSYILHRRHDKAETSGGRGIINRICVEKKRIFNRKNCYKYTANLLLRETVNTKDPENKKLLYSIATYDESAWKTIQLIFNTKVSCDFLIADLLIRIKMIFRIY